VGEEPLDKDIRDVKPDGNLNGIFFLILHLISAHNEKRDTNVQNSIESNAIKK